MLNCINTLSLEKNEISQYYIYRTFCHILATVEQLRMIYYNSIHRSTLVYAYKVIYSYPTCIELCNNIVYMH